MSPLGKTLRAVLALSVFAFASCTALAQTLIPAGSTMAVPGTTLDLACTDLLVQGTLTVGAAQINQSATVGIAAGGQLSAGQGTITVGGNWNNSGSFVAGSSTVVLSDVCGNPEAQLSGNTTFYNLTLTSTLGKKFQFLAGTTITVTGTLRLQGVPGNPIQLLSPSGQPIKIILAPGAQLISSDVQIGSNLEIVSPTANSIPTLSEYAIALLILLMTGIVFLWKPNAKKY